MFVFLPPTVTRDHSSESGVNYLDNYRFGFQFGESLELQGLRKGRGIFKMQFNILTNPVPGRN